MCIDILMDCNLSLLMVLSDDHDGVTELPIYINGLLGRLRKLVVGAGLAVNRRSGGSRSVKA